jgi:hypothetical protein
MTKGSSPRDLRSIAANAMTVCRLELANVIEDQSRFEPESLASNQSGRPKVNTPARERLTVRNRLAWPACRFALKD